MPSPPYTAAVIGRTGRGDYGHGLDVAFRDHAKLRLVAVADENATGRAAAAKRLGVERVYADYREMLDKEKPQFVAVAPRWIDCHKEMVVACAQRGSHIFCEKPMAPDLASCDAMVDACSRSHVKLAVAFQTRYSPRLVRVKELIEKGAIGEVLELRGRGKEDRRGGGEDLLVLGPHIMNLFETFLGEPSWCFARVSENGHPIGKPQVRVGSEGLGPLAGDRIDAVYGFQRTAVTASFASSRPREGANQRFALQILGSKGKIVLGTGYLPPAWLVPDPSWTGGTPRSISSAGLDQPEPLADGGLIAGNALILDDLIRAVETDGQPLCSVSSGRTAVEMVLACFASQVAGKPVEWPLALRAVHPLERLE